MMSGAVIVLLALVGLLVAALAFYLIWVVLILRRVIDTLGKITFGVRAIGHRTGPLDETVDGMNTDLVAVAEQLEGLVAKAAPPSDERSTERSAV
jgi:hypothetical protein